MKVMPENVLESDAAGSDAALSVCSYYHPHTCMRLTSRVEEVTYKQPGSGCLEGASIVDVKEPSDSSPAAAG